MNKNVEQASILANTSAYNLKGSQKYSDSAPHLHHHSLINLQKKLIVQVFYFAKKYRRIPRVLDLGAGNGEITLAFLNLGAKVTAVDVSRKQLKVLLGKAKSFKKMLEVRQEDAISNLDNEDEQYDIIVASSFLHHIPNYLKLIRTMMKKLNAHGQLFFFQDPIRYDTMGKITLLFSKFFYFSWRIFKGDLIGGMKRRLRRSRGIYLKNSIYDNTEYHAVRNGVDQKSICRLLKKEGLKYKIIYYFSTQSSFYQILGTKLGLKNTFAVMAKKIIDSN